MAEFYVTTFCNFAHRLKDGKLINHECYILPPRALEAERIGDYEKAQQLISEMPRRIHRGVRETHEKGNCEGA